jgi:protocatechuate 3,4-dioxygenase beta subunit
MEEKMYQISIESFYEYVLIKGYVLYKDNIPVKNAIVILEKYSSKSDEELQEKQYHYLDHQLTNKNGEFCFFITDKTSCYKIKVFDNHHS